MARNEHGQNFLELGFDWYILENWSSISDESKLEQHLRLGTNYAHLGHRGRRHYIRSAFTYTFSPTGITLPRALTSIPSDLLTPRERLVNTYYIPIWLRTDYSPGTDTIHHSLLTSIPPNGLFKPFEDGTVLDNAARYSFLASQPLEAILAFIPLLIEFSSSLYTEIEERVPWESEALQAQFLDREGEGDSDEVRKHKRMVHQRSFFVADEEAMRTGFVLWVHLDQFGNVLQRNRVQPLLFGALGIPGMNLSLAELGVGYEDGRLEAVADQWGNLRPKLVGGPSNNQVLDNLLAFKTEQRFIG